MGRGSLLALALVLVGAGGVALVAGGCSSPANGFDPGDPDSAVDDDVTQIPLDDASYIPLDAADFEDVVVEADLPPPVDSGIDAKADAGTGCAVWPDGTPCKSAPNVCFNAGVCKSGQCFSPTPKPEGYNWNVNDPNARCCGGSPLTLNTSSNCGACGIKCNPNNGESCSLLGGRYFCRGCIASSGCWSGCCSTSFTPYTCSASDCKGNCDGTKCPANTTCKLGLPTSSNYCGYP